jgi:hypothetical protein
MQSKYVFAVFFALVSINGPAAMRDDGPVNGVIIQFNGARVMGVEADTNNKDFKAVFEKELAKLSDDLPGKPELKITYWYTVINGAAIHVAKGEAFAVEKLMAALKNLPYVKNVEPDGLVGINHP